MLIKNKRFVSRIFKIIILIMFFTLILANDKAYAEQSESLDTVDEERLIEEQTQSGEAQNIEGLLQKYSEADASEIMGFDPMKIIDDTARGKFELSVTGILNRAARYLLEEIYLNIGIMIKLIVLVILCALLKNLQASFLSESVGELAFYTCYIVIVSILIVSLNTVMQLGTSIVKSMVDFMHGAIPVMITLLVSGGNITSAGVLRPLLILAVEVTATLMNTVFLPLIFLSAILSIVDNISEKIQVGRLASFLKHLTGWVMGVILTIFIGIVSIQGSMGAVIDGVSTKAVKYAISAFIPIVGKCLSDAAETVLGATMVVRNAAGVAVMIGVLSICIVPLLKIFALIALYKLTCILIEPISEKRIINCINDMVSSITYVLAITAAVAIMFLMTVTVMINASNMSAMIR